MRAMVGNLMPVHPVIQAQLDSSSKHSNKSFFSEDYDNYMDCQDRLDPVFNKMELTYVSHTKDSIVGHP